MLLNALNDHFMNVLFSTCLKYLINESIDLFFLKLVDG